MQYFDDFNAFRDDAHMAAWQPYHISGFAWETFSLVWSGAAHSPEEVFAQLSHRGYSKGDYAAVLQELVQRGWLQETTGTATFSLTEQGRAVREQIERLTDRYFYAPWSCLIEQETAQVPVLLTHLRDQFQELEASAR
jgi:DNA-binding MarR family transcriptional regulator